MKAWIRIFVKTFAIILYRVMCVVLPVNKRRIVFDSSLGRSYSGNPRRIFEYMVENGYVDKWECTWFYEKAPYPIPGKGCQFRYGRFRYLYYMATAKVWIFDCRQPEWLIKRKDCLYIQTWHGTPLKKLVLDMDDVFMMHEKDLSSYQDGFVKNVGIWDVLISQSPYASDTFRRAFAFEKDMLEIGYPRNDILFSKNNEDDIRRLKMRLGLPLDKKVMLYAPTFRDDEFDEKASYKFSPKISFERIREEFGGEYVLIVKYHYLIMDCIDWLPYKNFIYHFDQSDDIAELFLVSDIMITDYSSVMFDYSILRRPMFFCAYDLDKYKNELRGFYFDYEREIPGPISTNTETLIRDIRTYDASRYKQRYEDFCRKYNPWDDGRAAAKVVEVVERALEGRTVQETIAD